MTKIRSIEEIELEIARLHESTRTALPFFTPLHNWLRLQSTFYYRWHLSRYKEAVQWLVVILWALVNLFLVFFVVVSIIILLTGLIVAAFIHRSPEVFPRIWQFIFS